MKKNIFPFRYPIRVRYSEVDPQGIVFNAHYLTYFDCIITEYYRKLNYNYIKEVKKHKKDFHVIKTVIDYKAPIYFDDIIDCCIRTLKIGNSSLVFDIGIFKNKNNKIYASGQVIQVYTDQINRKSCKLPVSLVRKIRKFENKY